MLEFVLSTSNNGKLLEFQNIFNPVYIKIEALQDSLEVDENGDSFYQNAFIKAQASHLKCGKPTLSDDSGLVLVNYPDLLGVQSARFFPDLKDYSKKCDKLLEIMGEDPKIGRDAYFICVLCFYFSSQKYYFFEGRLKGTIAQLRSGSFGFGYDPIFLPEGNNGKSLAELPDWKLENSHRSKACKQAESFFKEHPGQIVKK